MPVALGGQTPPAAQQPLAPLPVTRLEEEPREAVLDSGRTFSLRLTDSVPVKDLLILLVRDTRFSIVAAPGVEGSFVGELKDVTLKQALDLVLEPLGLAYTVDGSFIRVFPRRQETRRFDVNAVLTERTAHRSLGAPLDRVIGGTGVQVEETDHANLFEEIAAGVRTLLSPTGRFNLDRKAGLVQATDYPDRLDQIALYLEAVDARLTRQVALQAWVVEVELDAAHVNGLDWSAITGSAGGGPSVTRINVTALLAALDLQGDISVLASPRVVAMNNEPAVMRVGRQNVYFVTTAAGGAGGNTSEPRAVTEGLVLSVTPQIAADGVVQMSVMPSVTEKDDEATSRDGDVVPILSVREATTVLRLRAGETMVVSGLMRQRQGARTDLVILLTPTIVTPGGSAPADGSKGQPR
jgi:MSHA biogenesis protein MshL